MHKAVLSALSIGAFLSGPALSDPAGYEVWGSDQSNSVAGASGVGREGSFLWIWKSKEIEAQVAGGLDAWPVGCGPSDGGQSPVNIGPCDLLDVFPQDLEEVDADGRRTGNLLRDLNGFGRLHGMIADPQDRYVNANIFAPGGGYVGIIDTRTKEAVALFRVTGTNVGGGTDVRSVHMSFWTDDGSAILVANLNGKLLERIDITRNGAGKITDAALNLSATLGVGKGMNVTAEATAFSGSNAHGKKMIGRIIGSYADADLADLTPNGECKENGCDAGLDAASGGRPNNVIICPISSRSDNVYVTMGGGGLIVADVKSTPMKIVGEYGQSEINAAGCGGVQAGDHMWINAGVSASGAGATWSTFTVYRIDDTAFLDYTDTPNQPFVDVVFADSGNTATGGFPVGDAANNTGQLPGFTTRRDSHGMVATVDEKYVHVVDRIQNVVEVFDTETLARSTYDLTSEDGQGSGVGPCALHSVSDDTELPMNDPAPDLLDRTPDGKYLMLAFRGPIPVSVGHSAQGSCPGVGVVELLNGGSSGRLVSVLRARNFVDTASGSAPGGHAYAGFDHSDVHGAIVVKNFKGPK